VIFSVCPQKSFGRSPSLDGAVRRELLAAPFFLLAPGAPPGSAYTTLPTQPALHLEPQKEATAKDWRERKKWVFPFLLIKTH